MLIVGGESITLKSTDLVNRKTFPFISQVYIHTLNMNSKLSN